MSCELNFCKINQTLFSNWNLLISTPSLKLMIFEIKKENAILYLFFLVFFSNIKKNLLSVNFAKSSFLFYFNSLSVF